MDVEIAEERIVVLADRFNVDHAEGRAWAKRADAFGTVAKLGGMLNRAVPRTTSACIASAGSSRSGACTATPWPRTSGPRLLGAGGAGRPQRADRWRDQDMDQRQFRLTGLEACRDETEREFLFDGLTRQQNPALRCTWGFPGR